MVVIADCEVSGTRGQSASEVADIYAAEELNGMIGVGQIEITMVVFECDRELYDIIFFFFQAEDGIRDLTVTGVQTCALPISRLPSQSGATAAAARSNLQHAVAPDRRHHRPRDADEELSDRRPAPHGLLDMPSVKQTWRSLQEWEEDPVLLARAAQEFPSLAAALSSPTERR